MKNPRWFPIRSATACLLKWSSIRISLWNGKASSCQLDEPFHFDSNFHNSAQLLRDRTAMINGEWPSQGRGCERCKIQECSGNLSLRRHKLYNIKNNSYTPKALENDKTRIEVNPTQLKVFFNNKCNLKCIYCGPKNSSSWLEELIDHKKDPSLNWFDQDMSAFILDEHRYQNNLKSFRTWFQEAYKDLKQVEIQGGEPFLQKEFWDTVNWFIHNENQSLEFKVYSNLQIDPLAFHKACGKLKKLSKSVDKIKLFCSIDGWNDSIEYIRHGLSLETFERNLDHLLSLPSDVEVTLHSTVTCLSVPALLPLIERAQSWNRKKPISLTFEKCKSPSHYDPNILPPTAFINESTEILQAYAASFGQNINFRKLERILRDIQMTPVSLSKMNQLEKVLEALDGRRSTDWRQTFPWLGQLMPMESQNQRKLAG